MDMSHLIVALAPAFAAGFALQRLLEILDPVFDPLLAKIKIENIKKIVLGLISLAAGLTLASWPQMRILTHLVNPEGSISTVLDYVVTALIVSGGTEGFNSILKFLDYQKQESKAAAVTETLQATEATNRLAMMSTLAAPDENREVMSELSQNLVRVINRWSTIETPGFDSALVLKALWDSAHLQTVDFDPDGIADLIDALKHDSFFRNHQRTRDLKKGFFAEGGGISSEGDLFGFYNTHG